MDQVVAMTNQGYINSKIPIRVRLHCLEETTKPEADVASLTQFGKYKGGGNDLSLRLKELRGSADAAALIIKKHERFCGTGCQGDGA